MTAQLGDPGQARSAAALTLGCAGFVLLAVAGEVLGGLGANSPAPAWAEIVVPLAWPRPLRILWWLAVAAAAGGFRLGLHRLGMPQRRWVVVASVAPFLIFAAGIAAGTSWATWH